MGVRTTDESHVALYDSVTGLAFGTTFPSREHAEDFLEFTEDDPRTLSAGALEEARDEWGSARLDEDGNLREKPTT